MKKLFLTLIAGVFSIAMFAQTATSPAAAPKSGEVKHDKQEIKQDNVLAPYKSDTV